MQIYRAWPVQFELPAHGQILASLLIAAGFEAVKYPSAKSGKDCLAVFPQNIFSPKTWVTVSDPAPEHAIWTRVDMNSIPGDIESGY